MTDNAKAFLRGDSNHFYLSSACLHEALDDTIFDSAWLHDYCEAESCKWCTAKCHCPGHKKQDEERPALSVVQAATMIDLYGLSMVEKMMEKKAA